MDRQINATCWSNYTGKTQTEVPEEILVPLPLCARQMPH